MSSTNIFHQAIVNRDLETIKRILEHESWKATNDEGETVLHLAFKRKNQSITNQKAIIQIFECFMEEGISFNVKNSASQTVLFSAVENRLRLVIDYLVQHGANINVQDQKGNSIIHTLIEDQFKQYPKNASIELLECVEQDDINFMTWLLSKGVNVDCRNKEGKTAFILAIERNLNHIVPILMRHMIDVNHFDEDGCTIIESFFKARLSSKSDWSSNFSQDIEIVKYFLDKGVSVDHVDKKGNIFLHTYLKSYNRNPEIMRCLVQRYTKVNTQDPDGNTVLHLVIKNSLFDSHQHQLILNYTIPVTCNLLSKGANVDCRNKEGKTAFILAVERNLNHVVPILMRHMIDVNHFDEDGCTIIESFFKARLSSKSDWSSNFSQDIEIVNYFLDKGVSVDHVDKKGNTLLHSYLKSYNRNPKVMQCMVQRYTKVNTQDPDGNTVLYLLMQNNSFNSHHHTIPAIRTLLSKGANVNLKNHDGDNPVRFAFRFKQIKLLKELLEHGADLTPSTHKGALFLHKISNVPSIEDEMWAPMVDTLVRVGWNVNEIRPGDRFTPLMEACSSTCPKIAQKLIDNGADVNYVESYNLMRPIHVAAKFSVANNCKNTVALLKMLAKAGAKINVKNKRGETALHLVTHSSYHAAERLLLLGANVDAKDKRGRLPLHKATKKRNVGVIKILLQFGAEVNEVVVLREMNQIMMERVDYEIEIFFDGNFHHVTQGKRATIDCLTEQWLRLKAANLPVMEGFAEFANEEYLQRYYIECLAEVEMLKKHRINDRTTLYDLLHMDVNLRYIFIAKELKKLANSPLLYNQFPKYHYLITGHYEKAVARYPLIEPALRAWNDLTGIRLPDCVERILVYLDNEDLRAIAGEEEEVKSLKRSSKTTKNVPAKRMRLK